MRYITCQQCGNKFGEDDSNPAIHYNDQAKICMHCNIYNNKKDGDWFQRSDGSYHQKNREQNAPPATPLAHLSEVCGCGRPVRYIVDGFSGEMSCNKYSRCPSYEQLAERTNTLTHLVEAYRDKRSVDGLNGRAWSATRHFEAEALVEKLEDRLK